MSKSVVAQKYKDYVQVRLKWVADVKNDFNRNPGNYCSADAVKKPMLCLYNYVETLELKTSFEFLQFANLTLETSEKSNIKNEVDLAINLMYSILGVYEKLQFDRFWLAQYKAETPSEREALASMKNLDEVVIRKTVDGAIKQLVNLYDLVKKGRASEPTSRLKGIDEDLARIDVRLKQLRAKVYKYP